MILEDDSPVEVLVQNQPGDSLRRHPHLLRPQLAPLGRDGGKANPQFAQLPVHCFRAPGYAAELTLAANGRDRCAEGRQGGVQRDQVKIVADPNVPALQDKMEEASEQGREEETTANAFKNPVDTPKTPRIQLVVVDLNLKKVIAD